MNDFLQSIIGRTNKVKSLLVLFICLVSMSAYAQETISGKVTDEIGEGLPGVTLQVKGTSTGTVLTSTGTIPYPLPQMRR